MLIHNFFQWLENQDTVSATFLYLKKVEQANLQLIAHQTSSQNAMNIVKGQDFSNAGLEGTALFSSADSIKTTFDKMNHLHTGNIAGYEAMGRGIHKGSDAILVMAVPKKFRRISDLDEYLIDLHQAGKIRSFGLPNQYILGFWQWDGNFYYNSRFNPQGLL